MAKKYTVATDFIVKTQNFVNGINSAKQSTQNFVNSFKGAMQNSQKGIDSLNDDLSEMKKRLNINGDVNELGSDLKKLGANDNVDELSSDLKNLDNKLEDVGNEAEKQTGAVGGAFSNLKGTLGGLAGVIAGVFAVDKIIDFGRTILNTAADIQALNSQYDQVMGDMKATTDQYLAEMSQKWNKHPNELKSAYVQYVAILKSKGVEEGKAHELAQNYLDRTVDANAFANENMSDTVARFMGAIKGEYDSVDTAMVNLSATMLNDLSVKEYGKKFDELTTEQQETLKMQEMLRQHTSAGVFGQGEREASSYANNLAMVKNTWAELLEKYGSPLLDLANKGLTKLVGILENAPSTIDKVKNALAPIGNLIKGIFAAFSGDEDKASSLLEKLGLSSAQVQEIINAVNLIKNYLNILWQIGVTVFNGIKAAVTQLIGFLTPYILPIISNIVSFIGEKLQVLTNFWKENGAQITQAVKNAFNIILSIIQFVMPAVQLIINMVWNTVKGIINGALNVIMGLVKVFAGLFTGDWKKLWEGVKQALSGAVQLIWNFINLMFFGRILSIFKSFGTGALNLIKGSWSGIQNATISAFNSVRAFLSNIIGSVKSVISKGFSGAKDSAISAVRNLYNGIRGWFDNVVSKARGIISDITSVFRNFSLYTIGRNIVDGLINGITSKITSLKNKVRDLGNSISGGIKDLLGIRSPSRLMIEYGGHIGEGLAIGMDKAKDYVSKAATGLAEASNFATDLTNSMQNTVPSFDIKGGMNGNINQLPQNNSSTNQDIVVNNHLTFNVNQKLDNKEMERVANYIFTVTNNALKAKGGFISM